MTTVGHLLDAIDRIAPWSTATTWDRSGLQVGNPGSPLTRVAVSLDSSVAAVEFALEQGAQVLVSHHPLIWDPLKRLVAGSRVEQALRLLLTNDIAFIGAHTNWDLASGGVNDALATRLGLVDVESIPDGQSVAGWKLVTCVPESAVERVSEALFSAGAGRIGRYDRCSFRSMGTGTFRGLEGSQPVVGEVGRSEAVEEVRLETVVPDAAVRAVERALRAAHPYEEPAYDWVRLRDTPGPTFLRRGRLPRPLRAEEFQAWIDERLGTRCLVWPAGGPVETVTVCGGAAGELWSLAQADAYVTGEVKQDQAVDAQAVVTIVAAGHYATEQPGVDALASALTQAIPGLEVFVFEPGPGAAGRPLVP